MQKTLILYPIFPMFALTAYVAFRAFIMRVAAVKSGAISHEYYRLYNGGEEPQSCRVYTRHLANLLEFPPLFYISCVLVYIADINSLTLMVCAWLYVITRFIHSYVHLGSNRLRYRYRIFFLSIFTLITMWIVAFVSVLTL